MSIFYLVLLGIISYSLVGGITAYILEFASYNVPLELRLYAGTVWPYIWLMFLIGVFALICKIIHESIIGIGYWVYDKIHYRTS